MQGWSVVADCGRMRSRSPAVEVAAHAEVVALVTRPTLEGIEHARDRLTLLRDLAPRLGVILVGHRGYSRARVAEDLGVPVYGVVADDARGAELARSGQGASRAGRRTALMRSVALWPTRWVRPALCLRHRRRRCRSVRPAWRLR